MPLILVAVGIALVIASIRGTLQSSDPQNPGFLDLLYQDFVGPGNFFAWIVAIALVGAVGYYRPLRPVSVAFMILIIIVFLLAANKGGKDFFSSLSGQLLNRNQGTPAGVSGAGLAAGGLFSLPSLAMPTLGGS